MGKNRDLFKKIRDTQGTFNAKMGLIKDRNGLDLTEAEILRRGGKNTQKNCPLLSPSLHVPLVYLIFLKRLLVFPTLLFSSISLH